VAVADVNRDGKPDLIVARDCATASDCAQRVGPGFVGVLLGNCDGTFPPTFGIVVWEKRQPANVPENGQSRAGVPAPHGPRHHVYKSLEINLLFT
jgi:hypothetical protein